MTGSEFIESIRQLPRLPDREEAIFQAVANGFYVDCWIPLGKLEVAADYLAIGTDEDFVRVPCSGPLALRIAKMLGGRLPTTLEVDAIWNAADVRLVAMPWGPNPTLGSNGLPMQGDPYGALMLSVERFAAHNARIEAQRAGRTGLIAGHKKDVLGVRAGRLAFYGWQLADGTVIQHDDGAHEASYADYSHGVRLVRDL